ncbi:MAG TPA: lysine 5,6-aminomutase subunit alpha [Victivallales bacterium]|nr:lysine 5,6-aminomutase subunit alpha [Victivallales bacterium]
MIKSKLGLSEKKISEARELAAQIVKPVQSYIAKHTTDSLERATLRMFGADGVNSDGVPIPNILTNQLKDNLGHGTARYYINALLKKGLSIQELNDEIAKGLDISKIDLVDFNYIEESASELVEKFKVRVSNNVNYRKNKIKQYKEKEYSPLLYLIVATGNIYEDVKQAQAASRQGADIIAVIRTTGQSLLDYVPYVATTEGFGGTYATQENFKIMRSALDEVGEEIGKYIRLVNYCSGLCMPEIAAMGAVERLDMMLNDSMYGILFRDINMYRTFVDQHFSRMINSYADIVINTGEDNYLTTSDAVEKAYTVTASQLINEQFAFKSGMKPYQMGLGHAFEMDPNIKNGFLYELSQAEMAREIFPKCPLKYMPPTKYMTGDIFKSYAINTMFNFVARASNQGILLLGMLTEAIHTPFMQDRYLAVENAKYVLNNIADFSEEIKYKKNGIIQIRAKSVLKEATAFLKQINEIGLFDAVEKKMFAEISRPKNGGKGLEGVKEKEQDYWNPMESFLEKELNIIAN